MKLGFLCVVKLGAVILLASSLRPASFAQTNPVVTSAGPQPSIEDLPSGRPTLKLRAPASDRSPTNGESTRHDPREKANGKRASETDPATQNPLRIEFDGLHAFKESEVLKAFREEVPGCLTMDSDAIDKAVAVFKGLFQDLGYALAVVNVSKNDQSNSITFHVDEGVRFPIAEVRFAGNKVFPSSELTAKIGGCLKHYEEALSKGYDHDIFEYCQRSVSRLMRSQGYLQARLGEPARSVTEHGLVLTIPVEEGILYRFGNIKIEGAEVVSAEEIKSTVGLQRGEVANGEKIGKAFYEDLKRLYAERGFIEYTAELNPTFRNNPRNTDEGIADFEVTIDEGRRFTLRSIKFTGDEIPARLLDLFLIREGDVYNQRLFEESIARLNETGWFEPLDKDKDVGFRADEEDETLAVVIKVQKRSNRAGLLMPPLF